MFATWPDSVREPLIEYHLRSWRKGLQEIKNLETDLYDEVRHGPDMPDVPLIVLATMGTDRFKRVFTPESYLRKMNDGMRVINAAIAESVPRGELRVLENAGHSTVHVDCTDAVMQAIRDLVNRVNL
jgi:hypothetical protein